MLPSSSSRPSTNFIRITSGWSSISTINLTSSAIPGVGEIQRAVVHVGDQGGGAALHPFHTTTNIIFAELLSDNIPAHDRYSEGMPEILCKI